MTESFSTPAPGGRASDAPSLNPGARLGAYEVLAVLGAGGMGEVYKARDTRLGREVAIKTIREPFAADADRVARFQREAKLLASLNHPHIAALYGLEESTGQHFIVMELVEGETLADRLAGGPLPVKEALAIGVQIAEALEAAHEKGVVHRDLKPANVKVTPDDRVKVLDFGLAKAVEREASGANAANSPTISMMASQAGIILGTAAYMSPEQAKGFPVDHRSDVFSFGSVLFEMISGRTPFQGDTVPDLLASVLVREADMTRLPKDLPPRLTELIRRCLEKQPRRRWQAIGDVRAELESIAATPSSEVVTPPSVRALPLWRRVLPAAASAAVVGVLSGTAAWMLKPAPPQQPVRFSIPLPVDERLGVILRRSFDISPDGSLIAYAANRRINLRPIGATRSSPIAGTESGDDVLSPTFSPDGRSLVYYSVAEGVLKGIDVTGGTAVTLCPADNPTAMSWAGHAILFINTDHNAVWRVQDTGGNAQQLVSLDPSQQVDNPQMLPDGDTLLLTVASSTTRVGDRWNKAQVIAQSLKSGTRKPLIDGGSNARYLPTGHLVYAHDGVIYAQAFNARTLTLTGVAFPVLEGVHRPALSTGTADFSVSNNGTLAYIPGPTTSSGSLGFVLADRQGVPTTLKLPAGAYSRPRVTRDGKRIALQSDDHSSRFIGIYETDGSSALRRMTYGANANSPVWSPDGTQVAFQVERDGDLAIFAQPADGSGAARRLTTPKPGEAHVPQSWFGDVLLFDVVTGANVALHQLTLKDGAIAPFGGVRSSTETGAVFSPEGKWVAYSTTEEQATNVFVQPFPATGARYGLVRPSPSRAARPHNPLWAADGTALFYLPGPNVMERVPVETRSGFVFGNPERVPRPFAGSGPGARRSFDMMPDGRILGLGNPPDAALGGDLHVVLNWFEEINGQVRR